MRLLKCLLATMVVTASSYAQAALSPSSLNLRDLNSMTSFISQHEIIALKLKQIDLMNLTITYGDDCIAYFERNKPSLFNFGRVGPQPDIEFSHSSCDLNER